VKLKYVFFLLLAFSLIATPIYLFPRKIVINSFSCESQFGHCDEKILEKIEKQSGSSLKDAKKNISDMLKNESLVEDFSLYYKIPNKLDVHYLLRKPEYGITFNNSESVALIDKDNYVVAFTKETSLPILESISAPPQVGERIDTQKSFALKLVKDMYEYYQVKKGQELLDGIKFDLEDKKNVIFPKSGDREILIASLTVILTRLNADDSSTRIENVEGLKSTCQGGCTIDLRYKNPVIR
jgi:hypothetical protein